MRFQRTRYLLAMGGVGGWLIVACAGAKNTDLFVESEGPGRAPAGATIDASGVPEDATRVDARDAGFAFDDARVEDSAGSLRDSGGPSGKIACGAIACARPTEVCCLAHDTGALTCSRLGSCAGTELTCVERADCPASQTCCGNYVRESRRYERVACADSCDRNDGTGFEVTFCSLRKGDADCPSGQHCFASQVFVGFNVCG